MSQAVYVTAQLCVLQLKWSKDQAGVCRPKHCVLILTRLEWAARTGIVPPHLPGCTNLTAQSLRRSAKDALHPFLCFSASLPPDPKPFYPSHFFKPSLYVTSLPLKPLFSSYSRPSGPLCSPRPSLSNPSVCSPPHSPSALHAPPPQVPSPIHTFLSRAPSAFHAPLQSPSAVHTLPLPPRLLPRYLSQQLQGYTAFCPRLRQLSLLDLSWTGGVAEA